MKSKSKFLRKSRARKPRASWAVAGVDLSLSSIAVAVYGYDGTLRKLRGPKFVMHRWEPNTDYFSKLKDASKGHEILQQAFHKLKFPVELESLLIAVEEPFPIGLIGMRGKGQSAHLKQQAEISGAFLGGIVRYGHVNVFQINSIEWRTLVANDLGITTHHTKWKSGELAQQFNCKPDDSGKFRAKQWALLDETKVARKWKRRIPNWPDIIDAKGGKKPRPKGSVAKAVQPDDRYDALAIMEVARDLAVRGGLTKAPRDSKMVGVNLSREVR